MTIEVDHPPVPGRRYEAPDPIPADPGVPLPPDSLGYRLKRRVLGPPLHSDEMEHQRLGKPTALAVFASDNLSSSAYATEEILHALVPVVHVTALQAGVVASGAVVVEKIFSWPGLGTLLQESLRKGDLPVVQGVVVVAAGCIAASGLVADLCAALVDPRLRPRARAQQNEAPR